MAATLRRFGGWLYQQPYLLVSFTYLVWAINIVLGRYAAGHVPPIALSIWRWAIALLILMPFVWPYLKRDWPIIRQHAGLIILLSLLGTSGYSVMAYWGLQYTQAINALLIQSTIPMAVGAIAFLLLGDRLTGKQAAGIAVSFLGVVTILIRGDIDVLHSISFNPGDIWFIGAALAMAIYSALVSKRPAMHPLSFLAITSVVGVLSLVPVYAWEIASGSVMTFDAKTIWVVLYIGIFPSLLAYICFNRGVELIGPNRTAALYPSVVVFGSTIAIIFLGERPQLYHAVGFVLVMAGVLLATRQTTIKAPSIVPPS